MLPPLPDDVRAAMDAGQKVEAIRLLRERTGMGLADAKAAVEAGTISTDRGTFGHPAGLSAAAADALAQGNVIDAIRLVRQEHGVGLKQARDMVERARRSQPSGEDWRDPMERRRNSAGMWVFVVVLALLGLAIWKFLSGKG